MNAFGQKLVRLIKAQGPMSIAEYMTICLTDPTHGYYTNRDPLGRDGDFVTAPEISQMFGELIGLCMAQSWLDQGGPVPFALAEAGPGRGTLMADILRATAGVPGFHAGLSLHLIETSPPLRAAQEKLLHDYQPTWHDSIATLPAQPLFLVANEFLDALPIRQFQRHSAGWSERVIGIDDAGALAIGLTEPVVLDSLAQRLTDTQPGMIVETSTAVTSWINSVSQLVAQNGGMVLILDYGGWHSVGDTFQAVLQHRRHDPLTLPGQADLTAHVDFEAVAQAGEALSATPMTSQGEFLERLGITSRAQALAKGLSGKALENHITAHRRLTHPDEMGSLFKAMALYPRNAPIPPGFAT